MGATGGGSDLEMESATLTCPHCGLIKAARVSGTDVEYCPRCLARSGGALAVYLSTSRQERCAQRRASGWLPRLRRRAQPADS
jgi:Zn-finger nucleic acid-binding protein